MGCDIDYPRPQSAWDEQGIEYEEWFELFPVPLRNGHGLVCGKCGAQVGRKAARLHRDWHEENDGTT